MNLSFFPNPDQDFVLGPSSGTEKRACILICWSVLPGNFALFWFLSGHNMCSGILGWPESLAGKHVPFFEPLLIPKWSISRGFRAKWSLKIATNSLKKGSECMFEHPKWCRVIFAKTHFRPIIDAFSVPKWAIWGPIVSQNGPQPGQNPENGSCTGSFLKKLNFGHFHTHFGPILGPLCFGVCFGAKSHHVRTGKT